MSDPRAEAPLAAFEATPAVHEAPTFYSCTPLIGYDPFSNHPRMDLRSALIRLDGFAQQAVVRDAALPIRGWITSHPCSWVRINSAVTETPVSSAEFLSALLRPTVLDASAHDNLVLYVYDTNERNSIVRQGDETSAHANPLPRALRPEDTKAQQALKAMADLQDWLSLSKAQVGVLAKVSDRAVAYWASETTQPHASSTRRLYEIHALVASLIARIGLPETVTWLNEPSADGSTRLQSLADDAGPRSVTREARPLLFAAQGTRRQREIPDFELDAEVATMQPDQPALPGSTSSGVRRARRIP